MTTWITDIAELEDIYGAPGLSSTVKVLDHIDENYARLIAASPFVVMATRGETALDCSPRGDAGPVAALIDPKTLHLPDRRGNNRIDSLRNLVRDPRIGLIFLIPGSGTTVRVNGTARISADPALLDRYRVEGKAPRTVIVVDVQTVFFQCARAIARARLWARAGEGDLSQLPSVGEILQAASSGDIDGKAYDAEWPERARKSLW